MNKAVFLDRDGVINIDSGYVYKSEDFYFTEGIFDFCRTAREKGYLVIVFTNQSGIARGYYTEDDFAILNIWMLEKFTAQNINISKVYYCPFHPEIGIGKYKRESHDRKPNPGMLLKAQTEFEINMSESVVIGDRNSDMEAGRRAGVKRLLLLPSKYVYTAGDDIYIIGTLREAENLL